MHKLHRVGKMADADHLAVRIISHERSNALSSATHQHCPAMEFALNYE